jgi:2-C-methyl-D-erythritol 2,4-cyclodiphosphate synthase
VNRVGIGYDVHPLVAGRRLVLGGVEIPHTKGLAGHSDADALCHAIADALYGALGVGDIGQHFPNTDKANKDRSSLEFLRHARDLAKSKRATVVNVDATVIAQEPKLMPHMAKMKAAVAQALGVNADQIGIKATTNEHLGFIGRGEGIAAMAVASVAFGN